MQDKAKLTIRLAGLSPMTLESGDSEEKEIFLKAEEYVNTLWEKRSHQFQSKSSEDILAMVAFEFASLYLRLARNEECLRQLDGELDRLLHGQSLTDYHTDNKN